MTGNVLATTSIHLVIVPGHAVYDGRSATDAHFGKNWIGTYTGATGYRFDDEVPLYVRHVQRGINLTHDDPTAVLVFSGGKTRRQATVSEAESYSALADQLDWFGCRGSVAPRARL